MRITITGKNMDLTNGLKNQVTKKLSKLEKYFADDAEARVVLSKSKGKEKIEVTIPTKNGFIRAEDATDSVAGEQPADTGGGQVQFAGQEQYLHRGEHAAREIRRGGAQRDGPQ